MENINLESINEFERKPIESDIKQEFKKKYGLDITKYFNKGHLDWGKDFKYHGKYKGRYEIFTYFCTYNDKLTALCPVLDLDASENHIGGRKDVDLLVEHLKELIDLVIADIKQSGGVYHSAFSGEYIRV